MSEMKLTLTSPKIEALLKRLSKLDRSTFKAIIDHIAGKLGLKLEQHIAIYPPAPADSDYRRTGYLGRSITSEVRREGKKTYAVVGTNAPHAIWVIGPKDPPEGQRGQSHIHKGIWLTIEETMIKHLPEYESLVEIELEAAVKVYFPLS
jgi:hypothetical protein